MSSSARFPPVLALGTSRACLTVARSLTRHGIPVDVAAHSPRDPVRHSRAVRAVHKVPNFFAAPEHFLDSLLALIAAEKYELIIPASDTALAALHRFYEPLSERTRLGCPPPAVLDRILRKDETLRIARECGVAAPPTCTLEEARALGEKALPFPLIAKPASKYNEGTFKTRRLENCQQMMESFEDDDGPASAILVQAYCPGEGVGVETVFHNGRPLVLFQHRRLKEYPYAGGVSVVAVSEAVDAELAGSTLRLLRALEWEGPAMVEFRQDRASGSVALMEVNGRLWGSLPLSWMAGVDFPYYAWQLARGETPAVSGEYRVGLRARWAAGDLQRLAEIFARSRREEFYRSIRWRECRAFLSDFGSETADMVWTGHDPFPAFFELAQTSLVVAKDAVKGLARRAAPTWLRQDLRTARDFGAIPGALYLRARAGTWLARRRQRPRALPARVRSILFLCHGNIIRSALAEALVRRELAALNLRIASAGVGARTGREPDERACEVARELGVSLEGHRARPVTDALLAAADVVFVMDELNEGLLLSLHPHARRKLRFLGEWDPAAASRVIHDPYCGSLEDVRRCGRRIQACAVELGRVLKG
jgi:protein-tyrosine-phosphatase/predicted ATP-grasp superfamily ATP-dependent carboligase